MVCPVRDPHLTVVQLLLTQLAVIVIVYTVQASSTNHATWFVHYVGLPELFPIPVLCLLVPSAPMSYATLTHEPMQP